MNQLDSIYAVLLSEEKLQSIQNKWFYPERIETGIPSWVWKLAVAVAAFSAFFMFYYFFYRIREKRLTKDLRKKNARLSLILKTSNVRFWTYDIYSKIFTQLDENGIPKGDSTMQEVAEQYVREDFVHLVEAINHIVRGEKENDTIDLRTKSEKGGESREYTMTLSVLRYHKSGRPAVLIGTRSDITEEKRMRYIASDNMLRYQAIFSSVLVDMVYFDNKGNLRNLNDKACRTFNSTLEQLVTRQFTIRDVLGIPDLDVEKMEYTYITQIFKADRNDNRVLRRLIKSQKL